MIHTTLTDLYTTEFVAHVNVTRKELWKDGNKYSYTPETRRSSVLLYIHACTVTYTKGNEVLYEANPGDFIYIPSGAEYTCTMKNCDPDAPYQGMQIDFCLLDMSGERIVFADTITPLNDIFDDESLHAFHEIYRLEHLPEKPVACVNAQTMMLVHKFSMLSRRKKMRSAQFNGISKGIEYMERDPDQRLSVAEVAALCPASTSCFNRLFKAYSGMTPVEYRYNKKIIQAKTLLRMEETTVKSVSVALDFENTSYFCRMFKKKTGLTPKEYRKRHFSKKQE
ncbi:MAG: helix-turn-helix transcriptional regulator [Clostridia bacterium]|nr:helix-turn-helix transcriptional regulator [Clostridia bacterium]